MSRKIFTIALLFIILFAFSDEPPSWSPNKITSSNGRFFCWIDYADTFTAKNPYDRKWEISVFRHDSILLWRKDYRSTGYNSGILSNNGKSLVYVDDWYRDAAPVIVITKKNAKDIQIVGPDFSIPENKRLKAASHQIWLENKIKR